NALGYAAAVGVIGFSALAVRPAVWANQWSAAVYRATELAAVAQQSMVRNDAQLDAISDEGPIAAARSFDEMRTRKLAMFADRSILQLGDKVRLTMPTRTAAATVTQIPVSEGSGKTV